MSRKKLIAIGCSFTRDILSFSHVSRGVFENSSRGVFKPGYDFPVWPTLLADKLDMDCLNLGRGGMGNDYISAKLVDTVLSEKKEDIGLVVLMWSGWQRIDYQDIDGVWEKMVRRGDAWNNNLKYNNAHNATTKSLRYFLMSQMLLKDIPYLMIQGVDVQYKLAAEQGIAYAQYNLGLMYENGDGVSQDYKTAVKWYRLSAEQGNASAQTSLGVMYANGKGVLQDYKTALKWWRLSAEQGDARAQMKLGWMYADGQGVLQDYKTAVKWWRLSAEQGYVTAELKWPQIFLNSKIFDEIDEKKFIGWPIMREIGGYNVIDMLDKLDPERTQLRISKEDHHPNAEGHKIIAQEIYNAYEKVYI